MLSEDSSVLNRRHASREGLRRGTWQVASLLETARHAMIPGSGFGVLGLGSWVLDPWVL